MAPKRKLSDGGGGDGPDPAADPTPADEADDAGGPMVSIWSCNNPSVEVKFPVQHAWLLLRNWFEPSVGEELTKEQRMQELVDSGVVSLRMQPRSCCAKEVLECIRDYVRDYVLPDGAYKAAGVWNFRGDATLAIGERRAIGGTLELGALCWKLLQAADFLDIEIWPEEAVKRRNDSNQTHPAGHDRTFYNEVCKKLAGFVTNATSIQEIRNFCGVTTTDFNEDETNHNMLVLRSIGEKIHVAIETEVAIFGDGQVILPEWVQERHLPSICASIGGKVAIRKVRCMYRLACLCKAFKELLCTGASGLHTSLRTLGACTVSQVVVRATLVHRRSIVAHLYRYIFGPRGSLTPAEGWKKDIADFLASDGQVPYCEFFTLRYSELNFQTMVQGASSLDLWIIVIEVNSIAAQRYAQNMQDTTFTEEMETLSGRFFVLSTLYQNCQNAVVNTVQIMNDHYIQYFATKLTTDELQRMDALSVQMGVTSHKGAKEGEGEGGISEKTELHQSFLVNGWYLRVIVTQHHSEREEDPTLLQRYRATEVHANDTLEMDRIVYPVNTSIPVIKVRICNLERKAIEDDVECDSRQLVIKNTKNSNKESLTRERSEVTLKFKTNDMLDINYDILELYPWLPEEAKTAVLRIALRPLRPT